MESDNSNPMDGCLHDRGAAGVTVRFRYRFGFMVPSVVSRKMDIKHKLTIGRYDLPNTILCTCNYLSCSWHLMQASVDLANWFGAACANPYPKAPCPNVVYA